MYFSPLSFKMLRFWPLIKKKLPLNFTKRCKPT